MSKLPEPAWMPLSDAADFIRNECECSVEDARQALFDALRDGKVDARGTLPNPVYRRAKSEGRNDQHWQRAFQPLVGRRLKPDLFLRDDPDWQANMLGEVTDLKVNRASLLRWLGEDDANVPSIPSINAERESDRQPDEVRSTIEQAAANRSPLTHSGMAGRPTAKHLCLAELERRAKAGTMCGGVVAESRDLHDWLQQTYPELNPGKPKTIENNIRDRYRQLKAQRPPN